MLCKVEADLQQNYQKPQHGKILLWWTKSKLGKLGHEKDKQGPALNTALQNSTMMKLLGALFIIKVFAQVDIRRNIYFT